MLEQLKMTTSLNEVFKNENYKNIGTFGKLRVFRHQHTNYDSLVKLYNKNKCYMDLQLQLDNMIRKNIPELTSVSSKMFEDKLKMNS